MHSFLEAKIMAKALRTALAERQIHVTHSDALELVARQFGPADWNTLAAAIEAAQSLALPPGWLAHQEGERRYCLSAAAVSPLLLAIEADDEAVLGGEDFGTMMQSRPARERRGTELAFTAELRGEDAERATVWMRVNSRDGTILAFDNLLHKPGAALSGSFDWAPLSVTLPVAAKAERVSYGVMLVGGGRLEARAPRLHTPDASAG
ncbi:MAG TPA: glyoxalase superfamily protein [Devosia sp.]|nr:glyoxalase superfamily protein [Devosia sp.]